MATNYELKAQVRITNMFIRKDGTVIPKILSIKASRLADYVQQLINESNHFGDPHRSSKFDYLPFLAILDVVDTGEEFTFNFVDELPKETVFNSKGIPLLIIIPEEDSREIGVNRFDLLDEETRELVNSFIQSLEPREQIISAPISRNTVGAVRSDD